MILSSSSGLGLGTLAILCITMLVLILIYVVFSLENHREMKKRLDETSACNNYTKDNDLSGVLVDLRIIENKLLKIGRDSPDFKEITQRTIKRIHKTQRLVYDLMRDFERFSLRDTTYAAKKITYKMAVEASEAFNDIVDLLLETKMDKDTDGALDLVEDLNLYIDSEVSNLLKKIDKINDDLKK
ncbi:hypothetical protein IKW75_00405 [Candidatus Saccharibacteria bacterium]|nr:hypothetical protein [Candidatus Saccharibacteria bacterium]